VPASNESAREQLQASTGYERGGGKGPIANTDIGAKSEFNGGLKRPWFLPDVPVVRRDRTKPTGSGFGMTMRGGFALGGVGSGGDDCDEGEVEDIFEACSPTLMPPMANLDLSLGSLTLTLILN